MRHRVKTDAASCAEYGLPVSRFKRRLNPMPPLLQSASNTLDEKQEDGVQTMSRDLSFADLRALQPKENVSSFTRRLRHLIVFLKAKSSCQKASSDVMEGINTVAAQVSILLNLLREICIKILDPDFPSLDAVCGLASSRAQRTDYGAEGTMA